MNSVGQVTSFILTALILSEFDVGTALGSLPNPSHADTNKYMLIGFILAVFFAWPLVYCYFHTSEPSSKDMPKMPINIKFIVSQYVKVFKTRVQAVFSYKPVLYDVPRILQHHRPVFHGQRRR